jgi:hypothetical protein
MDPVSCVSCVSSCYCVNAGETHETFRQESGMRYQASSRPDSERESGCFMSAVPSCVPLRAFVHDSDGSSRLWRNELGEERAGRRPGDPDPRTM